MNIIKNYKTDIINLFVLTLIFLAFVCLFFGKVGDLIIDNGREAFFPAEILKGKVLYKDIFNIFGPLSYQLNALFYYFWGINLSLINIAGCINAFIILIVMYLISRTVTSPINSMFVCFVIIVACMFKTFIHNYLFPYSYAAVYALSSFLVSVLFCIYYIIKSKPSLMILSFFFAGLSLAFKYEFLLYFLFLFIIIIFIKPLSRKNIFLSIILSALPAFISFGILFYQGLTVTELISSVKTIYTFATTKTYIAYLTRIEGLYPGFGLYAKRLPQFWFYISNFIGAFIVFYFILSAIGFALKKNEKYKIYFLGALPVYYVILLYLFARCNLNYSVLNIYPFLGYFTAIFLIITICCLVLKQKNTAVTESENQYSWLQKAIENADKKDKIFLFLLVISIISAPKSFFYLNMQGYGTYFALLYILVVFVFIVDYMPKFVKFIDAKIFQVAFLSVTLASLVFCLEKNLIYLRYNTYPVKTKRGTIHTTKNKGEIIDKTLSYIQHKVPPNSKILVAPEGVLLNFLSDRPAYDKFYSLIPNHIETFGEEKIIRELSKDPPEYIFINNRDCSEYGNRYFCKDFAFGICKFVKNNYEQVEYFSGKGKNRLSIRIYRLKSK